MKALTPIRSTRKAVALGLIVSGLLAGGAQAATAEDAVQALTARSESLNLHYGLGGTGQAGGDAVRALEVRSVAMNDLYGPAADAIRALEVRSGAMNELYRPGGATVVGSGGDAVRALAVRSEVMNELYASGSIAAPVADTGFDWNDAGIGVAMAFGALLVAGLGVVLVRRQRRPLDTRV